MSESRVVTVERVVPADRASIFELLAHPARHTEIDGSGQLQGEARGPERLSLGDRFSMQMKQSRVGYRSVNEVVEFDDGNRIAWATVGRIRGRRFLGGQIWRFTLADEPGGGTRVTHDYDWGAALYSRALKALGYPDRMRQGMTATLDRLAQVK